VSVSSDSSNVVNYIILDFPGGSDGKASVYNAGDLGSIPGLRRFPGEGNGNPLQYSCLENPMDGESKTYLRYNFFFSGRIFFSLFSDKVNWRMKGKIKL